MRLWSLHPCHLDPRGLVALWREALLARAVLRGRTRGYRHHPQLARFQECERPLAAISTYLASIHADATRRGYQFDASLVGPARSPERIAVTKGQVAFEWGHLLVKLAVRSPALLLSTKELKHPRVHPLFRVIPGSIADWERT